MSLADELAAQPNADEPQYLPRTEYDGAQGYIQTGPLVARPADESLLRDFGYDPDEVVIVGNPHVSRWQQRSAVRDDEGKKTGEYETCWLQAYKFTIVPKLGSSSPDIEAMVLRSRASRRAPATLTNPYWFVFQAGDQQIGKRSQQGSTEEIVSRYLESIEGAIKEFKAHKRMGIEGIQLSFPGDCIEGVVSQNNRNMWLTQETITEQVRIFRRLLYHTISEFAPLADQLMVTVVNGNHDQSQRVQNTYAGDGWATECAIAVDDMLKLNPDAFGHVTVAVPDKWRGALAVQVGDTIVGVAHGHQWARTKTIEWLANQALNRHPVGAAQVLQHGHQHEWKIQSNKHVTVVCSPTFELASDWLIDTKGSTAKRGALTYLMRSGEVSRMSIV